MNVTNCRGCGRLFNQLSNEQLCPNCMKKIDENVNLDNLTTTKKEQRELTSKFDVALSNKKMNTNDLVKLLTALKKKKNKDNQ